MTDPQVHVPLEHVSAVVPHGLHIWPGVPHSAAVGVVTQAPAAVQQPPAHDAAVQTHAWFEQT